MEISLDIFSDVKVVLFSQPTVATQTSTATRHSQLNFKWAQPVCSAWQAPRGCAKCLMPIISPSSLHVLVTVRSILAQWLSLLVLGAGSYSATCSSAQSAMLCVIFGLSHRRRSRWITHIRSGSLRSQSELRILTRAASQGHLGSEAAGGCSTRTRPSASGSTAGRISGGSSQPGRHVLFEQPRAGAVL